MSKTKIYAVRETSWETAKVANALASLVRKYRPDVTVVIVSAPIQRLFLAGMENVINLDPFTRRGDQQKLDICRVFKQDSQDKCSYWSHRLDTPPLSEQARKIPTGEYSLVDDDIASGGTVAFVKEVLNVFNPSVTISKTVSLLQLSLNAIGFKDYMIEDVIDAHDFIPTAKTSGLVIHTPTGLKRELYSSAAVNLATRAKINNQEEFKKELAEILH